MSGLKKFLKRMDQPSLSKRLKKLPLWKSVLYDLIHLPIDLFRLVLILPVKRGGKIKLFREKTYTLRQIKKAFWKNFHESGEAWFDYMGSDEENQESTESEWNTFKEYLDNPDKCVCRDRGVLAMNFEKLPITNTKTPMSKVKPPKRVGRG